MLRSRFRTDFRFAAVYATSLKKAIHLADRAFYTHSGKGHFVHRNQASAVLIRDPSHSCLESCTR